MSGVGGGGAMVLYRARENRYEVIDYGMRAPNSLRVEDYPLTGDGAASDIFPWPRVKDDRNLHGPGSIAVPGVVAGMEEAHRRHAKMPWQELLGAQRQTRRRRPAGGLVDHADDREFGRRPAALSRQRRRLSAGRPAAERAMGHQVQRAAAAGPLKATMAHLAARRPARFLPGRSRAQHRRRYSGRRRRACRSRTSPPSAPMAARPLAIPYRGGNVYATPELTCGPTLAHTLRLLQQKLQPGRGGPDAAAYTRICAGAAIGLSRAALGHGRCRRPPRARRRASGAGLHHAFLGRRPRRQHGRGDADPAVDLRLEVRDAANRHHHEQRHHVVRPDAGRAEFAGAGQALPDQLHAGGGGSRRRPPAGGRRLRRTAHPAGGDAAAVLRDGLRHGPRCGDPHRRASTPAKARS